MERTIDRSSYRRNVRRDIARVQTAIREKSNGGNNNGTK